MESFRVNKLISSYIDFLYKTTQYWDRKRIILNGVIPLLISLGILVSVPAINEVKNSVLLILSILIGLLFSFMISFSDRINSEHLSQNASDKIIRLNLIKETSEGALVTILLSLFGLIVMLFLSFIDNNTLLKSCNVRFIMNVVFGSISLTVLYQIFLMLIYLINRLRKLINVDIEEERKYLEQKREKEIDDFESLD